MRITPKYLEDIISEARRYGASPNEIEDLKDYLEQIKSNKFNNETGAVFTSKTVDTEGRTVIRTSTVPIHPDDEDDFADLSPKSVKKGIYKSK